MDKAELWTPDYGIVNGRPAEAGLPFIKQCLLKQTKQLEIVIDAHTTYTYVPWCVLSPSDASCALPW